MPIIFKKKLYICCELIKNIMTMSDFIRLKKKARYLFGNEVLELCLAEQVIISKFVSD